MRDRPTRRLPTTGTRPAFQRDWNAGTWSLNCLFVPPRWRGHGVARALVAAAVALARRRGAGEIEAYPQVVDEGERQAAAFVWTGVPALFAPHGFRRQTPPGRGRALYLLKLR